MSAIPPSRSQCEITEIEIAGRDNVILAECKDNPMPSPKQGQGIDTLDIGNLIPSLDWFKPPEK
jgi:hypothetical protein